MSISPAVLSAPPAASIHRAKPSGFAYAVPALLLVLAFFVVPVAALLLRSVTEPELGLQNYIQLFGSTTYLRIFLNTFLVSGLVTVIAVVVGFPVAWMLAIMPRRWSQAVFAILILSMWTNLLARTYAWMVLLQRTGVINKWLMSLGLIHEPLALVNNLVGVTIGMTYIMLPFVILPLTGIIRSIDPAILQAASLCGATRAQALRLRPVAPGPARHPRRCAHGLRDVARLLRDPGTPRRHREHDAGRAHRPVRAVDGQLGHGRCRGARPARHHAWALRPAAPLFGARRMGGA